MATLERESTTVVGRRLHRLDGPEKVTGKFVYGADLNAPGMLHCKVFRSSIAHGLIKRLDLSRARALPGVRAVMSAADVPEHIRCGHTLKEEIVFVGTRVRHYGEPIAAVAADSQEIAEQALRLIEVEYEPLPVITDPEMALQPDAPLLHPDWRSYNANPDLVRYDNVCGHTSITVGDVEKAFAEADHVFEDRYTTHMVHQGYLEARAGMAHVEADGTVVITSSTQNPFGLLGNLSEILQLPTSKIRVIASGVGGGSGGKLDLGVEHFTALLARKTGRPVKYLWTREEEMIGSHPREGSVIYVKTGINKDGSLVARYVVAQDVGFAINPTGVEGQMTGGAAQGSGYTLSEEIVYRDGIVLNPNLTDFKMPTIMDLPRIETILVSRPSPVGPYGAKGVGEPPIVVPAAAISNAVADAIGVHIHDLKTVATLGDGKPAYQVIEEILIKDVEQYKTEISGPEMAGFAAEWATWVSDWICLLTEQIA